MKKSMLISAITGTIITMGSFVYGQEMMVPETATCKPIEFKTEKETIKFRQDSDVDYHAYKKEADVRIFANQNKISNLKTYRPIHNSTRSDAYNNSVRNLQQRNELLKNKIEESFLTRTCAWEDFKTDFSRDMTELEVSTKKLEDEQKKLKSNKKIADN